MSVLSTVRRRAGRRRRAVAAGNRRPSPAPRPAPPASRCPPASSRRRRAFVARVGPAGLLFPPKVMRRAPGGTELAGGGGAHRRLESAGAGHRFLPAGAVGGRVCFPSGSPRTVLGLPRRGGWNGPGHAGLCQPVHPRSAEAARGVKTLERRRLPPRPGEGTGDRGGWPGKSGPAYFAAEGQKARGPVGAVPRGSEPRRIIPRGG